MVFAADYPFLDVFWTMLVFFFWVIWIWILITVLIDLFRRHDISGWGKAAWALFVIVLPYLGVFVYLITQGGKMAERRAEEIRASQASFDSVRARDRRQQRADRPDREGQGAARQRRDRPGRVRRAEGKGARLSQVVRHLTVGRLVSAAWTPPSRSRRAASCATGRCSHWPWRAPPRLRSRPRSATPARPASQGWPRSRAR